LAWRPAYVALGSNLSDPGRQVEVAMAALAALPGTLLIARSSLWRSSPMGPQDQPEFVNAAAGLLTTAEPRALLESLQALERRLGKTEPAVRWGPRVIDLDLLLVGDTRVAEPGLELPHPGLHQRNFVLYPLSEIAAELWVPGLARVSRLREGVSPAGIERLAARGSGDH
jgi:2-amino-4-hydroxy-6-hydroxymethyldihydropteridine diphosphokinase